MIPMIFLFLDDDTLLPSGSRKGGEKEYRRRKGAGVRGKVTANVTENKIKKKTPSLQFHVDLQTNILTLHCSFMWVYTKCIKAIPLWGKGQKHSNWKSGHLKITRVLNQLQLDNDIINNVFIFKFCLSRNYTSHTLYGKNPTPFNHYWKDKWIWIKTNNKISTRRIELHEIRWKWQKTTFSSSFYKMVYI